jgi:thiosulfate/3-mercaptopyruvate sulfurtransferase
MTTPATFDPIVAPEALLDPTLRAAVRFIDVRAGAAGREAFALRRLSGAVHADLDMQLAGDARDPAHGGRHPLPPLPVFAQTLAAWGVTCASHVVVYDAQGGANAAARLWWMLRAVGHEAVQLLDGGWDAARAAGLTTEEGPATPPLPASAPYPVPDTWKLPTRALEDVDAARRAPDQRVLDVRAGFRFRGEREPIDPIAGHIPGAHNVFFEENLDARGRFLPADGLRAKYAALLDGLPASHLTVHCGSGVTACHTLVALTRAGLDGAALYVGSWSEWCRRDELPRAP